MATKMARSRLKKELINLKRNPVQYITAVPLDINILEWHFVIEGPKDTSFEGGMYHGILRFPSEYPLKPPSIRMITPNGRFQVNTRLCLTMSDFHPETWNPMWSVSSILTGLLSFMLESTSSVGTITIPDKQRRQLAIASHHSNRNNKLFQKLFPELVIPITQDKKYNRLLKQIKAAKKQKLVEQQRAANVNIHRLYMTADQLDETGRDFFRILFSLIVVLVPLVAILYQMLFR